MALLGTDTLGSWPLGQGLAALSNDIVEVAYMLAIEGLPYLWVTDHEDNVLLGSGSQSWIGQYEQDSAYTAHETVGQRQVIAGLKVPSQLSRGELNPKTGQLETTSVTFELLDADGILPTLFASEGKDFDRLGARVPPGTAALTGPTANLTIQGSDTTPAADQYIGLERIGPAGERAWFYPWPFQGIGYDHQVNQNAQDKPSGPPRTRVSASPLEFEGRKCVLYKLFRRKAPGSVSYTDWAHWGEQYGDGPPEWFGKLRGSGEYRGDGNWRLSAFGPESLAYQRMGTYDQGWTRIASSEVTLTTEQRGIAVGFFSLNGSDTVATYSSLAFGTDTLPASGTKSDLISGTGGVSDIVHDMFDGTTPGDFGSAGTMANEDFGSSETVSLSISDTVVQLKRDGTETQVAMFGMFLALHETVWRLWGFDPVAQHKFRWSEAHNEETDIAFKKLDPGESFMDVFDDPIQAMLAPGDGYWVGLFHTRALGFPPFSSDDNSRDNDGAWRKIVPLHTAEQPIILRSPAAEQAIGLSASFPYVEADPTVDPGDYAAARYFAFRGKRVVGSIGDGGQLYDELGDPVDELDSKPFGAVGKVGWSLDSSQHGSIAETDAQPTVTIINWENTRAFGMDFDQMADESEWSALSNGEYAIEAIPLHAYAYRANTYNEDAPLERAPSVFAQLLLSTGTATGWSGGTYTAGDNAPTTTDDTFWLSDITTSQLGLGIPYQLVQSPASILQAFDEVPGGVHGPLNRVRYAFAESFESRELLEALLRPRGLSLSMRGGKFGVVRLGLFEPDQADHVITDSSIHVDLNSPESDGTSQRLRASGAVDQTILDVGLSPDTGEPLETIKVDSLDPGAQYRRGDLEDTLMDPGLRPSTWASKIGSGSWLGDFRQLHGVERAEWLNKRHFLIETTLHRASGQTMWPGDRVILSLEKMYNADGSLGVTNAIGHVLSVTARPGDQTYDVEILMYADQLRLSLFAPILKVTAGVNGTALTIEGDASFLNHGEGPDPLRLNRPNYLASGTASTVCLLEDNRGTWTLHSGDTDTVASVGGNTVTLSTGFSNTYHTNRDYYLVLVGYDSQDVGSFARSVYLPYLLDTLQFGSGPTDGWPWVDG